MFNGNMRLSKRQKNNSNQSDYEIWRSSFSYKSFLVAILNFDNAQHDLLDKVLEELSGVFVKEFLSIKEFNYFLSEASFDYTLVVPADCVVEKSILDVYSCILQNNDIIDVIYSDEDILSLEDNTRMLPFFKPDFSPDTLMSFPYLGKVFLFRNAIMNKVGTFNETLGKESYYDFLIRCFESDVVFYHCPRVLFSQVREKNNYSYYDANDNARMCQEKSLIRRQIFATLSQKNNGSGYDIEYKWNEKPLVSIIIPSKDNYSVLKRCINSIVQKTRYDNYEIVVVDNGSDDNTKEEIQNFLNDNNAKYIYKKTKFNFSYMCNLGVSSSKGEFLLFLNDDTEIVDCTWLTKVLGQAMLPYSGAIGVKLLFGDKKTIQHCGVINNIGPTHAFWGFEDNKNYYFGRNQYIYNYLCVTAACLCVDRNKFDEVGGFNEDLSICYNDVELCYKLVEKGYYNTVRNDVILIHYESLSRGSDYKDEETERRLIEERNLLESLHPRFVNYDPFYNINLTQKKVDFDLHELSRPICYTVDVEKLCGVDSLLKIDSISQDEDICIRGWIVNKMDLNEDNCAFSVVLKSEDSAIAIKAKRQIREDVKENLLLKVSDVGFVCSFSKELIDCSKRYAVGLMVSNSSNTNNQITWTDMHLTE